MKVRVRYAVLILMVFGHLQLIGQSSYRLLIDESVKSKNVNTLKHALSDSSVISQDTVALLLHKIGVIYNGLQIMDSAYHYTNKALKERERIPGINPEDLQASYFGIALFGLTPEEQYKATNKLLRLNLPNAYTRYLLRRKIGEASKSGEFNEALALCVKGSLIFNYGDNQEAHIQLNLDQAGVLIAIDKTWSNNEAHELLLRLRKLLADDVILRNKYEFIVFNSLSIVNRRLQSYEMAIQFLEMAKATQPPDSIFNVLDVNLAYNLIDLNRYDEARLILVDQLEKRKALKKKDRHIYYSVVNDNLGDVLKYLGQLEDAEEQYLLAIWNAVDNEVIRSTSLPIEDLILKNPFKVKIFNYVHDLFKLYSENPEWSTESGHLEIATLVDLGESLISRIQDEQAWSKTQQIWQVNAGEFYKEVMDYFFEQGNVTLAYYYGQKAKMILANKNIRIVNKMKCLPIGLSKTYNSILAGIGDLQKSIYFTEDDGERLLLNDSLVGLYEQKENILGKIKSEHPDCYVSFYYKDRGKLELGESEVIYDYIFGKKWLLLFVTNQNGINVFNLDLGSINRLTKDWLKLVRNGSNSTPLEFENLIRQLSKSLYLESIAVDKNSVTIIPDEALSYIPFECLTNKISVAEPLIQSLEVSYAYSVQIRTLLNSHNGYDDQTLCIAPTYGDLVSRAGVQEESNLSPLKYSGLEAKLISEIIGGHFLVGPDASKEKFMANAPNYGILHLATHAVVDDENVDFSCIYFQPEEGDSLANRLYLNDLYAMQLPLEMVVLSACETGVGELLKGEGMLSLANGFTQAGAKSVITSLWKADDESTYKIMTAFYKYLARGQRKDEALRNAKLEYLENCDPLKSSPFYWAAFIPIGDMSPIRPVPWHLRWWFWPCIVLVVVGIGVYGYRSLQYNRAA